ncbi:MAG: MaoC family dehydratase [Actinomycetota bacterium]|nr:MaoC family dehydratase [Actinomycetota bacterium]
MRVFTSVEDIRSAVGSHLGTSDWVTIEQKQIDTFADATGDHQWIHVDPDKAKDGPFGKPIAHGFLTLSLNPVLTQTAYRVDNVKMGVNYGLNKVRFTSPVPVGSRVRGSYELVEVTDVAGGVQLIVKATIELEGSERPAAVAETLVRYYL